MFLSNKDYHKLVEISTEQEKFISSLETKLRIQTTISQDLDSLNKDFQKTIQELNKEIQEQRDKIEMLEEQLAEQKITASLISSKKPKEPSQTRKPSFPLLQNLSGYLLQHSLPAAGIFSGILFLIFLLIKRLLGKQGRTSL